MKEEKSITDLEGVGPTTADKLMSLGYDSLQSIASADPKKLANEIGASEPVARKMIYSARDVCDMGFGTGEDMEKQRTSPKRKKKTSNLFLIS